MPFDVSPEEKSKEMTKCMVCLCEYERDEELRTLPCFHSYHKVLYCTPLHCTARTVLHCTHHCTVLHALYCTAHCTARLRTRHCTARLRTLVERTAGSERSEFSTGIICETKKCIGASLSFLYFFPSLCSGLYRQVACVQCEMPDMQTSHLIVAAAAVWWGTQECDFCIYMCVYIYLYVYIYVCVCVCVRPFVMSI